MLLKARQEQGKKLKAINEQNEKLKALNEILALYDRWLAWEISDFEFFTLLNEIVSKYDLQ